MIYEIDILLATYNGEKYLSEQLDSLTDQTVSNWRLLVRDDGSSDSTTEILERYRDRHHNVEIVNDDLGNVGPFRNFGILLEHSKSEYVIFCDQDDIWDKNKLELLYNQIIEEDSNKPIIVHCDSRVIDGNNNIISDIFIGDRGSVSGIREILKSGVTQGSSMMINRKLIDLVEPLPNLDLMHDLYISLVCECLGKRIYVNQQLMGYRHHENNVLGETRDFSLNLQTIVKKLFEKKKIISNERKQTIDEFFRLFGNLIKTDDNRIIQSYLYYINSENSRFKRVYYLVSNDFIYSCGRNKNVFLLLRSLGILLGRY